MGMVRCLLNENMFFSGAIFGEIVESNTCMVILHAPYLRLWETDFFLTSSTLK